jgi:phosphoesterase RecJ-like protein
MPIAWDPFVDLVRRHQRFLLTTHVRPDGDALGSMLGLAEILRSQGKQVRCVVASQIAPRYNFLYQPGDIDRFAPPGDALRETDVAVVLDTSAWSQLGDYGPFFRSLAVPKAVIDHHQTQDDLGALRLVDTTSEATGRLVFEAAQALGVPLTESVASKLFVALAMDTGWFRHSNATASSYTLAAQLIAAGANPEDLYDRLFEQNSLARLRLTGVVLERLQTSDGGRIAWSEIHKGDYEATGAVPQDSEDLVNYARSVIGVVVGLFFMEQPRGGIKVSFRSRGTVDVARVAERFGGGGHRAAAGATLNLPLDEARSQVLAAVREALAATPA